MFVIPKLPKVSLHDFSPTFLQRLGEKVAATFGAAFAGSCIAAGIGVHQAVSLSILQRAGSAGVGAVVTLIYGMATKAIGDPNEPAPVPAAPAAAAIYKK